jgi:hypothetical protein
MVRKKESRQEKERLDRADRLKAAITGIEQKIAQITSSGEVAPPLGWIMRYQARGYNKT